MKPIIRVENLSKQYKIGENKASYSTLRDSIVNTLRNPFKAIKNNDNKFWALKDVNFEINSGEVVGIIGRNGAGKSTLLKILSRITEPTIGEIALYGRVGSLLEVGTGFHAELTGRENIFLNGAILGMRRSEIIKNLDEIIAFAEIEKFIDTPVKHYSSGMYVRLAFAVAAHLNPEILIIDEVLAVGDAEFQKKCLGKMSEVAEGGRTVLFVSHNITAIQSLCSKALLLKDGQVVEFGLTKDVVNTYLSKELLNDNVKEWSSPKEAPGDNSVYLKRVAVIPQFKDDESEIKVNTPLDIEFEFWNLSTNKIELNVSVVLWSFAGECIFNVISNTVRVSSGICKGKFNIPANFLNDNNYSIELYIIKDTSTVLFKMSDIVSFEVHDVQREINFYGKWIGAVRPMFDFKLSKS